jgi:hypothetical protein
MTDYISRDDVLKAIDYQHEVNHVFESEAAYVHMWETINDDIGIKSADVQPVEHGRWEDCEIRGSLAMRCSVCGNDSGVLYNYAYCPNCGARMDLND